MPENARTMSGISCVLLCLMCVGFMNQGTLIAVILLIVIILENHGRITVGSNKSEFVFAILFAITFMLFGIIGGVQTAYIGLLVPIGYCIGTSLKYHRSEDVDNVILLVAFSMNAHLILNLVYEMFRYGLSVRLTAIHYDIWSGMYISSTGAMINATPFLGCVYFLIFKSNRRNRIIGITLLVINTLYDLIMGGRSFMIILFAGIIIGFLTDTIRSNGFGSAMRKVLITGSIIFIVAFSGYIILRGNSSFQSFFRDTYFYKRFFRENAYENIMTTGRTNIRDIYLSNMWKYPIGGRKLWGVANQYAHELYLDIYDIGGVVPYFFIILFIIQTIINCFKFLKNKDIADKTRVLVICFFACLNLHFFIEPVLSGAPTLLVIYCIVAGYISKCSKEIQIIQDK